MKMATGNDDDDGATTTTTTTTPIIRRWRWRKRYSNNKGRHGGRQEMEGREKNDALINPK
jgi:hypothetical protein